MVLEVWDGKPIYRKSWAGILLVWSDLAFGPLLLGQMRTAKLKIAYNSLIIARYTQSADTVPVHGHSPLVPSNVNTSRINDNYGVDPTCIQVSQVQLDPKSSQKTVPVVSSQV